MQRTIAGHGAGSFSREHRDDVSKVLVDCCRMMKRSVFLFFEEGLDKRQVTRKHHFPAPLGWLVQSLFARTRGGHTHLLTESMISRLCVHHCKPRGSRAGNSQGLQGTYTQATPEIDNINRLLTSFISCACCNIFSCHHQNITGYTIIDMPSCCSKHTIY